MIDQERIHTDYLIWQAAYRSLDIFDIISGGSIYRFFCRYIDMKSVDIKYDTTYNVDRSHIILGSMHKGMNLRRDSFV